MVRQNILKYLEKCLPIKFWYGRICKKCNFYNAIIEKKCELKYCLTSTRTPPVEAALLESAQSRRPPVEAALVVTGSIAQSANLPVFSLLRGRF